MDATQPRTESPCKKLHEMPLVATDWQQTTWCPDCDYYDQGTCGNLLRIHGNTACPFDGTAVPLRQVVGDREDGRLQEPRACRSCNGREHPAPATALEQAVRRRIADRAGTRLQALAVELVGRELVIRGSAPCYHVKQLALQGVLDALGSAREVGVAFSFKVEVRPDPTTR